MLVMLNLVLLILVLLHWKLYNERENNKKDSHYYILNFSTHKTVSSSFAKIHSAMALNQEYLGDETLLVKNRIQSQLSSSISYQY